MLIEKELRHPNVREDLIAAYASYLIVRMQRESNVSLKDITDCLILIDGGPQSFSGGYIMKEPIFHCDMPDIQQSEHGSYRIDDIPLEVLSEAFSLLDWDENPRLNTELLDRLNKANELLKPYLKS